MTMRKIILSTALALGLGVLVTGEAQAACPVGQFYLDLKSCTTAALAGVGFQPGQTCQALAPSPAIGACPAAANWKRATLKIALPTDCTQANVVVEYEGLPAGWTINIGDSPTNDGFAGDAGTTANNAELWIFNELLSVANASNNPALIDNPLVRADLALTDGALKFVVKNQSVSWGHPYSLLQMPATKHLFAIPDGVDGRTLYVGLNQVVSGRADRRGCGARRVLVTYK